MPRIIESRGNTAHAEHDMRVIDLLLVQNFGPVVEAAVELNDLSVLVGPNGAGKSRLLGAFAFLGLTARADLPAAITTFGGMQRLRYFNADPDDPVTLGIMGRVTEFSSPNAPDVYLLSFAGPEEALTRAEQFEFKRTRGRGRPLRLQNSGQSSFVLRERFDRMVLAWRAKAAARLGARIDPSIDETEEMASGATALATLRKLPRAKGAAQFDQLARLLESFEVFAVNDDALMLSDACPTDMARPLPLARDASNLHAFLFHLQKTAPEVFGAIEADLARIVPGMERLIFEVGNGHVTVTMKERAFKHPTYLHEASFGTRRALGLLAMLHDPHPPRLSCVEEVDHGLHPHALDLVVDRMREASTRTQLLSATHSPALVNRLLPKEIIVCERDPETGSTRVPSVTPAEVIAQMDASGLSPGELWFSGALGGVP